MKKTISMLLCCAMLGTLCACQHGGDYEKRTYVPQFDMTVSYGFEDEELKSDDGTMYYRQSLGTATVSSKDERAAERINSSLAELYVKFGADAEYTRRVAEDQTDGEQIALSYYCAPSVTRCDTRVLSAVFDVSQDIGGIHADSTRTSRSYNADNGSLLTLADIAKNEEQIKTFIKNYVIGLAAGDDYKEGGVSILFDDFESTIKDLVDAGANWYFSDGGLVFYANPYDIAPYSRGVLLFEIPYSALEEFIDEGFMPVEYEGENGMLLADDGDKLDRSSLNILGTVTVDEDGQSVVLSAEETVYNVKIYTSGRMLWQRNYLTTGEGVEVKSFIPDAQPSIAVSYELADGTEIVRGIFQSGKDGSILLVDLQDSIRSDSAFEPISDEPGGF
ncbi:MAG: RsiV family protein [Oscillospiraceae bacterium]|nr:RsiV family protein [Oscillospiraceae bacterium]